MNSVLCIGGPQDAQVRQTEEAISPMQAIPTKLPVVCENGLIKNYIVQFLAGGRIQFPIAVWEDITPDDVFKLVLNWYAMKSRIRLEPE